MTARNLETISRQARLALQQRARQQALLVPWRRLDQTAETFVNWHSFVLWVRSATEFAERIPESVLSALEVRCPGFLAKCGPRQSTVTAMNVLWRDLEEWIANEHFAEVKRDRWFDAVLFYAYSDLRVEQAWAIWHLHWDLRSSGQIRPCPSFDEWNRQVAECARLAVDGSEKDRAVGQLARVDSGRLEVTTSDLIERRGYAFWLAGIAEAGRAGSVEFLWSEVRRRYPEFPPENMRFPFLFRLIRFAERQTWLAARAQGWDMALRYRLLHSSRYHRLVHFLHKCHEDVLEGHPSPYLPFDDWLRTADDYVVAGER